MRAASIGLFFVAFSRNKHAHGRTFVVSNVVIVYVVVVVVAFFCFKNVRLIIFL